MLVASLLALALAADERPPVTVQACPLIEVHQFSSSHCTIEVQNLSDRAMRVADIKAGNKADLVHLPDAREIAPHGIWQFDAEIAWEGAVGQSHHQFEIAFDGGARQITSASAFVESMLDEPRPKLDFGPVDAGKPSASKESVLASREDQTLRATRVLEKPDFLAVKIADDGKKVLVSVTADAPWGMQSGVVKLATNNTDQPQVWIEAKADVHGKIVPAVNPIDLGLMRIGNKNEFLLRVTHVDNKPFKIGAVKVEGINAVATLDACAKGENGCRMVRILVDDKQDTRALKGRLLLELPEFKRTLPVDMWGLLVAADTKIKSLNNPDPADIKPDAVGAKSTVKPAADLKSSLKEAVAPKVVVADPPGHGPLLKWSAANEQALYGYAIYRAEQQDGPQKRINHPLLRVSDIAGLTYAWRDTTAVPGTTYWYRITALYNDGRKEDLTELTKVVAK